MFNYDLIRYDAKPYYYKDQKWVEKCRWCCGCLCHESLICGGDRPTIFTQRWRCPSLQPERGTDSGPACCMWMMTRERSAISP